MNFYELYNKQELLDKSINELHKTTYKDTLEKRILAFLVELGEFANETRCFKYWSLKGPSEFDVCLEEYIDGLHFIMSIGIALGCDKNKEYSFIKQHDKTNEFITVYNKASSLKDNLTLESYYDLMQEFLNLGSTFGFEYDNLIDAYNKKNKVNYERQENKY